MPESNKKQLELNSLKKYFCTGKKKFCYECGRELEFEHFFDSNPNLKNAVDIFYSDFTQFYCCSCFRIKTGKKPSDFRVYQYLEDFCDEEEFFMSYEGEDLD